MFEAKLGKFFNSIPICRLRREILQPDQVVEARSQESHRRQGLRVSTVQRRSDRHSDTHAGQFEIDYVTLSGLF